MLISEYIDKFVSTSSRDNRFKNKLNNLNRLLSEYDKSISINGFSEQVTEGFISFLRNHNKKYRPNTVRALYQLLCYILNRASKEYKIDSGYMNIRVCGEDAPTVYLTMDEIKRLVALTDISKRAAIIRDYFVLMCMTGLRLSDVSRLTNENILNGYFSIKTQKTGQIVKIPIHPFVRDILNKWNNRFPKCSTQQAFYKTIQRLCKYAGIVDEVLIERTVGNEIVRKVYKKYSLVTPHTGRRSFATNAYLAGIPTARIMLLTGHKTEQSFFKYIRIGQHENAISLSKHPFFVNN